MIVTRTPGGPVFAKQYVTFRIELERGEPEGEYTFWINKISGEKDTSIDLRGHDGTFRHNFNSVTEHIEDFATFDMTVKFTEEGMYELRCHAEPKGENTPEKTLDKIKVVESPSADPALPVALVPAAAPASQQATLWLFIERVADRLRFEEFGEFVQNEIRGDRSVHAGRYLGAGKYQRLVGDPSYGSGTYRSLHRLSKDFVTRVSLGERADVAGRRSAFTDEALDLSYVSDQDDDLARPFPFGIEAEAYPLGQVPFVELIFVYWMEEAMVFQTLNHVIARFQNRRVGGKHDPLARLSVNPLMPLRGLLWGLAEAEGDRLTVRRRAAEYEYQYGLQLIGRAIPPGETLVERRTQFLEAFHTLLNACQHFYDRRDDKTVQADPFPLLSNLRELHLVLARGANNQFADLPLTARIETIDVQWMLAQPEMREFLGGPTMVPYEEPWMDRVDTMKSLQGWSDDSVTHFYDLAFHGEQILLSVRHGRWNESHLKGADAENWALHWRNSIQRYMHAYRAVTGVDLIDHVDVTMPSTLLARRLSKKMARF